MAKIGDSSYVSRSAITKTDIINEINGVTGKSTDVAQMIQQGKLKVNLLGDELYTRYYGDRIAHCEFASNGELNLYLRRNSASLLEDVVHEGTHGIDMYNKFGSNPLLTTRTWEFRAYQAEGEFQRAIGKTVQYPTGQSIMNHITNNYPNADLLFNPYNK